MKKLLTTILAAGLVALNSYAALVISNTAATSLTTTSMVFNATLVSTNGSTNAVSAKVFYGTVDYTTNMGSWAYSNTYSSPAIGSLSTQVVGLSASHKYYFAWYVAEGTNIDWATPSLNAWTKPTAPTSTPAVVTISLQIDMNGLLKAPTNFWTANKTNIIAHTGAATGTPIYVETDAIATNMIGVASNYFSSNPSNFVSATVTNDLNTRVISVETGKVDRSDTNGWTVTSHTGFLTNEALWIAASNGVVYTANTSGWVTTAHQAWITNDAGATNIAGGSSYAYNYATKTLTIDTNGMGGGSGTFNHPSLTNQNGDTNFLHMTAGEKVTATQTFSMVTAGYLAFYTNGNQITISNSYSDAAIVAATNALNIRMGVAEASTNSLQVQVTDLKAASNALNIATNSLQVQIGTLNVSTAAIDAVATAALPASSTNALAVTALQITGLSGNGVVPVGASMIWWATNAPDGWLVMQGQAISTNVYSNLYASAVRPNFVISTTNMILPDTRGRVIVGMGTGGGLTTRNLGETNGTETVVLSTNEMPAHVHNLTWNTNNNFANTSIYSDTGRAGDASPNNTASTGGGLAHSNMPPYLVGCYIIKY